MAEENEEGEWFEDFDDEQEIFDRRGNCDFFVHFRLSQNIYLFSTKNKDIKKTAVIQPYVTDVQDFVSKLKRKFQENNLGYFTYTEGDITERNFSYLVKHDFYSPADVCEVKEISSTRYEVITRDPSFTCIVEGQDSTEPIKKKLKKIYGDKVQESDSGNEEKAYSGKGL